MIVHTMGWRAACAEHYNIALSTKVYADTNVEQKLLMCKITNQLPGRITKL